MRSYLFVVILLLSPNFANAQRLGKGRSGSALVLKDTVYTFNCFVSVPGETWTLSEMNTMLQKQAEAFEWISNQAAKNNSSVYFMENTKESVIDIKLNEVAHGTASGSERVDWVSSVLKEAGYNSSPDFYYQLQARKHYKNVQVIIFAKGKGTGYAMAFQTGMDTTLYFLEGAILYEKYWTDNFLAPSGIAHEILHLYGAWDLYKTFEQPAEVEEMAKKQFPNSIMLRTSYDIKELEVDELTAWLVGWNNTPQTWYDDYRPKNKRR